jgi:hypothetical protein
MPLHQKALLPPALKLTSHLRSKVLALKPAINLALTVLPLIAPQTRVVRLLPKALLILQTAQALKPLFQQIKAQRKKSTS